MTRLNSVVESTTDSGNKEGGTNYIVETPTGVLYMVYIYNGSTDEIVFRKSTDGGKNWSTRTVLSAATQTSGLAVWYDRWSGISAGLIHVAYTENDADDVFYRTIDTESSDALSTETTIYVAGSGIVQANVISIVRSRGGNVYCLVTIDAGTEETFARLLNADVPNGAWAARTINENLGSGDTWILQPGFAADNNDILCIFWDASSDEISRYVYDDSADTWAETSIVTSMTELSVVSGFPNMAATPDLANNRVIMVAWTNTDVANADLRCWTVSESAITETSTNVVLNSGDDQAVCGIHLDPTTGWWYVPYWGKSDGSETFTTSIGMYYKVSQDGGTTWGPETELVSPRNNPPLIITTPRRYQHYLPVAYQSGYFGNATAMVCNVELMNVSPTLMLGA